MSRLEKISQLSQQREATLEQERRDLEQKEKETKETIRLSMEQLRSTLVTLNIQQQLEEIRDTVWQMGSIETREDPGTFTFGLGLVAEVPCFIPGEAGYRLNTHNDPDFGHWYWVDGTPDKVTTRVVESIWIKATSKFPEKEYPDGVKVTISDSDIIASIIIYDSWIHQGVIEGIDVALTEACLRTKNVREIVSNGRNTFIGLVQSGRISREIVPQEFQQYLSVNIKP